MKNKYLIFILILIICIGGIILFMFSNSNGVKEFLQDPLRTYNDSQYGRIEHGAIVITSDGKYRIEKNIEEQLCFNMYYEVNLEYEVLKLVTDHKKEGNNYFIKSEEGYAIVNIETEKCKVFVTVPEKDFKKYSGSIDESGNKIFKSRFVSDEHITYLNSYYDFSKDEQMIFEKMGK